MQYGRVNVTWISRTGSRVFIPFKKPFKKEIKTVLLSTGQSYENSQKTGAITTSIENYTLNGVTIILDSTNLENNRNGYIYWQAIGN